MNDLKPFLRTQPNTWLQSLQTKLADAILANTFYIELDVAGKGVKQKREIPVAELSEQLVAVMVEKGIVASTVETERQTLARFA